MKVNKTTERVAENEVLIEEKVSFLGQPSAYSYQYLKVEVKETHMSWVFLLSDVVYKLKKPVVNRLFDFRTLDARLRNCKEEVRLNKRLAGDIYLGIVPLVVNDETKLQIGGKGKIVDWLVKMKRIPEKNMLDYAIQHNCIDEIYLRGAARLLAEFYKTSPPVLINVSDYIKKLDREILFNYKELSAPLFGLSSALLNELTAGQMNFLDSHHSLFSERIKKKKVIETHGDLRPEHISLSPCPCIIDRLEFSNELRVMDVAEELSFLCIECEMMGSGHAGHLFLDEYRNMTGDTIPYPLINFYKIKRACLRAYLVARHKQEARYKNDPKWLNKANAYLKLAQHYHQKLTA